MELLYKPDFEETKDAWRHFWSKEAWKRPLVVADVPKEGAKPAKGDGGLRYHRAASGRWQEQLELIDAWFASRDYLAESIPYFGPDFGPDQFGAFVSGGQMKFAEGCLSTNWIDAVVEDWSKFKVEIKPDSPVWKGVLDYSKFLAEGAKGRFLVATCDLHSNGDALSAIRGGQDLCMDFYDCPELLEKAMLDMRKLYPFVYESLYKAGGMSRETGTIGWTPFWCEGRMATIQCDFICMVGQEIARKYIIPALEEEASFLDHCVYHFDGPGALQHLDDVLSIKDIDVIQWVSGDGQKPMCEWTDLLKKILKAGKALQVYNVNPEQVKRLHKELGPAGVVYCVGAKDRKELEGLLKWLELNM